MIYLIGTNHELQHNAKPFRIDEPEALSAREKFKEYLEDLCSHYRFDLIAEESCEELLKLKSTESTVKEISDNFGIEHKFCDPDIQQRLELGLPGHGTAELPSGERFKFHKVREEFWIGKLSRDLERKILFICGAEHIDLFMKLIESMNIKVKVLNSYWGMEYYE